MRCVRVCLCRFLGVSWSSLVLEHHSCAQNTKPSETQAVTTRASNQQGEIDGSLTVNASKLVSMDWLTGCYPLVGVFARANEECDWMMLDHTEYQRDTTNPDFDTQLAFKHDGENDSRELRFAVFDVDESHNTASLMGVTDCMVGDVLRGRCQNIQLTGPDEFTQSRLNYAGSSVSIDYCEEKAPTYEVVSRYTLLTDELIRVHNTADVQEATMGHTVSVVKTVMAEVEKAAPMAAPAPKSKEAPSTPVVLRAAPTWDKAAPQTAPPAHRSAPRDFSSPQQKASPVALNLNFNVCGDEHHTQLIKIHEEDQRRIRTLETEKRTWEGSYNALRSVHDARQKDSSNKIRELDVQVSSLQAQLDMAMEEHNLFMQLKEQHAECEYEIYSLRERLEKEGTTVHTHTHTHERVEGENEEQLFTEEQWQHYTELQAAESAWAKEEARLLEMIEAQQDEINELQHTHSLYVQLQEAHRDCDDTIASLRNDHGDCDNTIANLRVRRDEQDEIVAELSGDNARQADSISEHERTIADLQLQLASSEPSTHTSTVTSTVVEHLTAEERAQFNGLKADHANWLEEEARLLAIIQNQQTDYRSEMSGVRRKHDDLVRELEDEIEMLRNRRMTPRPAELSEPEDHTGEINALRQANYDLLGEKKELRAGLDGLRDKRDRLQEAYDELLRKSDSRNGAESNLVPVVRRLRSELQEERIKYAELHEVLSDERSVMVMSQEHTEALERQLADSQKQHDEFMQEVQAGRVSIARLTTEVHDLGIENDELRKRLKQHKTEMHLSATELHRQVTVLSSENEALKLRADKKCPTCETAPSESELHRMNIKISQLQTENSALRDDLEVLRMRGADHCNECSTEKTCLACFPPPTPVMHTHTGNDRCGDCNTWKTCLSCHPPAVTEVQRVVHMPAMEKSAARSHAPAYAEDDDEEQYEAESTSGDDGVLAFLMSEEGQELLQRDEPIEKNEACALVQNSHCGGLSLYTLQCMSAAGKKYNTLEDLGYGMRQARAKDESARNAVYTNMSSGCRLMTRGEVDELFGLCLAGERTEVAMASWKDRQHRDWHTGDPQLATTVEEIAREVRKHDEGLKIVCRKEEERNREYRDQVLLYMNSEEGKHLLRDSDLRDEELQHSHINTLLKGGGAGNGTLQYLIRLHDRKVKFDSWDELVQAVADANKADQATTLQFLRDPNNEMFEREQHTVNEQLVEQIFSKGAAGPHTLSYIQALKLKGEKLDRPVDVEPLIIDQVCALLIDFL